MARNMELAGFIVLALTAAGFAQEREPVKTQPVPRTPAGAVQPAFSQQALDAQIANCLALANQEEIALCRFAMEHADSDKVKEAAKSMMEDHQAFLGKLRRFTSKDQNLELRVGKSTSKDGIRQVAGTDDDRREARPGGGAVSPGTTAAGSSSGARMAGGLSERLFEIERQAHQECLKLTEECLGQYKGKEFDQAFLGQQVGMHIGMIAKLNAAENDVSPELQQLIREAQKATKSHREHAEKLMGKVAQKSDKDS